MAGWQTTLDRVDRVREHTAPDVQDEIDADLRERVAVYRGASDQEITERLAELDREWDIERVLMTNAATVAGLGVLGGFANRRILILPLAVTGFLLQHAVQGWCPPLAVFRRRGVRTRREIDLERYALKAMRGDLEALSDGASVTEVLDVAAAH